MKRALLKIPSAVYDFIYNMILQWKYMLGMGEKPRKRKRRNQGKKDSPRLVESIKLEEIFDCVQEKSSGLF